MKAVILCAGLGTRLRPITNTIPKVMVKIGGKPLIQHHIEWLVANEISDIGINLFYLPDVIKDFLGDGSDFGAKIHYSHQKTLSETASGFKNFKDFVGDNSCIVIYGDNFFYLDLVDFIKYHKKQKSIATIALKKWEKPETKGIVGLDEKNFILWFKEKPKLEEITTDVGNAGIYLLESEIFSHIPEDRDYDFGKDIFPILLEKNKKISGYHLSDYHLDIGSIEMLEKAQNDYQYIFKNKAVFLDRDGVLNRKPLEHDYVKNLDEFVWNDGAQELIKKIKSMGFLVIVISNQQGIAKGKMTKKFVESLHKNMNKDLKSFGTKIDDFYYCPHHKDENCTCRKPKPGLFFQARNEHKIDLGKSFMVGDSANDIEAAKKAGIMSSILIKSNEITEDIIQKINKFN